MRLDGPVSRLAIVKRETGDGAGGGRRPAHPVRRTR